MNRAIITTVIDEHERQDNATMDIPGAYLHTINNEFIIMRLLGKITEMMVRVDPQLYWKYVTVTAKGKPILYVKLNKALYGLLKSVLLWYKKLRAELEEMRFVVNPYAPCVANRNIKGSQMTIT